MPLPDIYCLSASPRNWLLCPTYLIQFSCCTGNRVCSLLAAGLSLCQPALLCLCVHDMLAIILWLFTITAVTTWRAKKRFLLACASSISYMLLYIWYLWFACSSTCCVVVTRHHSSRVCNLCCHSVVLWVRKGSRRSRIGIPHFHPCLVFHDWNMMHHK